MATEQTLNSDTFVGTIHQQLLYADTRIKASLAQTITAAGSILVTTAQTLDGYAHIKAPVIWYAVADVTKPEDIEKLAESSVSNPIPDAPTNLVAADAGRGDAINLNWLSTAAYFNVYTKVGLVLTKVNPVVLENTLEYMAGNLTPDLAITFVVKATNALGQESPMSNEATAMPTFKDLESRFTTFTYEVKVSGNVLDDAILSSINLGYGSNYSTASFMLPRDPRIVGAPGLDEPVEIKVNNRLVFKGDITVRSDVISNGGLNLSYTCHSTILNMTRFTYWESPIAYGNAKFNITETQADGGVVTHARANAGAILNHFGVIGGPDVYPGDVNATDLTPLAAAESLLSRIGNYKLYHDMVTGFSYAYAFGTHGFTTRQFYIGKNIVDYNITKSNMDIVNQIIVMGSPTVVTQRVKVSCTASHDPDGKLAMYFERTGTNIRDIRVYGQVIEKPTLTFNEEIQVCLLDFESPFSDSSREIRRKEALDEGNAWDWMQLPGAKTNDTDPRFALRAQVTNEKNNVSEWQPLGAKCIYSGDDQVKIYLQEVPKQWKAVFEEGDVKSSSIAANINPNGIVEDPDTLHHIKVLKEYTYSIGPIEVEYTVDGNAPWVAAGTGLPSKSITDGSYQAVVDTVSGINTQSRVVSEMTARANGELAQRSRDVVGGAITVVGDETIDLRSSVNVDGLILEVSGVNHSFISGFLTTIELTNEAFVVTPIFAPIVVTSGGSTKQREQFSMLNSDTKTTQKLAQLAKELQSQKEQKADAEKEAPKSSPFTTLL